MTNIVANASSATVRDERATGTGTGTDGADAGAPSGGDEGADEVVVMSSSPRQERLGFPSSRYKAGSLIFEEHRTSREA
ncbi:hypothetical protein AB0953_30505 [Streptomyces sp. NPDC046866]|uniref:hypothetical protein n=1 Tax=Streptomyces sp. NPDC046866 TaxID=3154921 RepID=UPI003456E107